MIDLAIYFLEHVSLAALVFVLGFMVDYVATPSLKNEALVWLRAGTFAISLRKVLTGFLSGFIYRLYGKRPLSFGFFLRSSLISCIFLALTVVLQIFYGRKPATQFTGIGPHDGIDLAILCILLFVNLIIDYISNTQTIIFLRMAASTGRVVDAVVAFYSDILVTLAIFTFLFPVGVVATILLLSEIDDPMQIEFSVAHPSSAEELKNYFPKQKNPNGEFNLQLYVISVHPASAGKANMSGPTGNMFIYALDEEKALNATIETVQRKFPEVKVIDRTSSRILIESHIPHSQLGREITLLYESAYRASNITRDGFWGLVDLETVSISTRSVAAEAARIEFNDKTLKSIKCADGSWRELAADILDREDEEKEIILPCDTDAIVLDGVNDREFLSMRMASMPVAELPITPFFMTSFTVSALYYCAILMSMIGIAILRFVQTVVSTTYLDVENKPFTVLGFLAFLIVLAFTFVARAL
jgi:hypothetical protein